MDWTGSLWATAEPVKVSGAVAEKLEKQRAGSSCDSFLNALHTKTVVRVEFTVLPNGSVTDVKELSHTGPLPYAHFGSLSQWTYNPYLINGRPTAMRATMLFECSPGLKVTYQ
jgi:hypothetical protein